MAAATNELPKKSRGKQKQSPNIIVVEIHASSSTSFLGTKFASNPSRPARFQWAQSGEIA